MENATLVVKVTPKSSKNKIIGWENGELKVRLRAIPEKGEANDALIEFLAEALMISKSKIILIQGGTSRHKRLRFLTLTQEELTQRLSVILSLS